jgi:hypothetical protein
VRRSDVAPTRSVVNDLVFVVVGLFAVFHGHAHYGTERGNTRSGVPVRNVAQPVIRHAFNVYTFEHPSTRETRGEAPSARL